MTDAPDDFAAAVAGVGALAEPVRRALYRHVAAQPEPVSREQAARACGVAVHTAKFHLDRLVDEGLLEVEHRRLTGRTGPGAGRPAKLYRRADREVSVSLPERRYDLAGALLAAAVEEAATRGTPVSEAVARSARAHGLALGRAAAGPEGAGLERAEEVLERHGYEPHHREEEVCLRNCPFHRLAQDHTELVCGMNLALVSGVLEGLGCGGARAVLDPEPGLCCVKVRPG